MAVGIIVNIYLNIISPEDYYDLECELAGIEESLKCDPEATYRVTMELTPRAQQGKIRKHNYPPTKQVGLTEFISRQEERIPPEFNEQQASALMGIEHPLLNARGKVEARWALNRVAKELGLEWEELPRKIEHLAEVKRRVKEIQRKLDNAAVNVEDADITIDRNNEGEL
jgi:hypothetical protein